MTENKYSWTKHWWTRLGKFFVISFDLLFLEPNSRAVWHPIRGNIPELIELSWKLTMPRDKKEEKDEV